MSVDAISSVTEKDPQDYYQDYYTMSRSPNGGQVAGKPDKEEKKEVKDENRAKQII